MMNARRTSIAGLLCILTAGMLAMAGLSVAEAGAPIGPPLLPNLVTRPIVDVRIAKTNGMKLLRFSTIVGNRGPGPAELSPDVPDVTDCDSDGDPDNDRIASQRIFADSDGDGIFDRGVDIAVASETEIGCFIFHPAHEHWHFEEFERYELRGIRSVRTIVSSEKVSFCLLDSGSFGSRPGTPSSGYYGACDPDVTMGLSVGWFDIYGSALPGQELDIRGVADGRYCLIMEADPGSRVAEADELDNSRSTVLDIAGTRVDDRDRRCPGQPR